MLHYHLMGPLPAPLTKTLLPRIAGECRRVRGFRTDKDQQIGLRFVSEREMTALNRAYRGKNCATDVLSFSAVERSGAPFPGATRSPREAHDVGDIVICPKVVLREAERRAIAPREELVRMLVHGTLHLAGYGHDTPETEDRMFSLQEDIIERVL